MNKEKAYLKYFAALLMFGMNGILAGQIALDSIVIVLIRTFLGSAVLILLFLLGRNKLHFLIYKKDSLFLFLSGAAMGVSWMFLHKAYQMIGVSVATLAYYCGPAIVMALTPVLFAQKLTRNKRMALLIVMTGMICVNFRVFSEGSMGIGLIFGILAAVFYAVMVFFTKKNIRITGLENAMYQLVAAFLSVAVFVGFTGGYDFKMDTRGWISILILGVVNTGLGCYLYFSAIDELPVQTVAVCGYLEPLSTVVFSMLFLREHMSLIQIAGAVLILAGALYGERKEDIRVDILPSL